MAPVLAVLAFPPDLMLPTVQQSIDQRQLKKTILSIQFIMEFVQRTELLQRALDHCACSECTSVVTQFFNRNGDRDIDRTGREPSRHR